jgi:hypothetical protein
MIIDSRTYRPADQLLPLGQAFALSGLTLQQLYWNHLSIGGVLAPPELMSVLFGDAATDSHMHNVLAQVVNEGLMDAGRAERVALAR